MRRIIIIFIYLLAFFLISAAFSLYLIIDEKSLITETDQVNPQTLSHAKNTLKQINKQLQSPAGAEHLSISYDNLSAIFSLSSDIFHDISARYNDLGSILLITVSIKLPNNPAGNFINIQTRLSTDYFDTDINRTTVGRLSISNLALVKILSKLFSIYLPENYLQGNDAFISEIYIRDQAVHINLQPYLNTQRLLRSIKSAGKETIVKFLPEDQFKNVQIYYDHLVMSSQYTSHSKTSFSLFDYLQLVINEAALRSTANTAKVENASAILALGLFVGDYNLISALNSVLKTRNISYSGKKMVLFNRQDLSMHFIYSSIIQILSNNGISLSLGEIKEISDSGKGGSGFSFIDITADRTGVKFAEKATESNSSALLLQERISMATDEKDIFPDIYSLKEQITEDQFSKIYVNRQSDEYKSVISEIDRRIESLTIFK